MRRVILAAILAIVATLAAVIAGSATATVPTGTWELIPAQTDTVGAAESFYQTAVRPPINADGSSVFSAKRGVVPVQFDVLAGTRTPHTIGPVYFESIYGGANPTLNTSTSPFAWSGLYFDPTDAMTFADVTSLVATYDFTTGTCYGGSLRWSINVQHNGAPQNIHVYYGVPNGPDQQCTTGAADGSGENLMDDSTAVTNDRFEFQSGGAPVYTTHAAMMAATNNGTDTVNWIGLIIDSGQWAGAAHDQVIDPATLAASVNGNAWVRETPGTTYTVSDLAPTCEIPAAKIAVTKTSGSTPGAVDEVNSVQPKDTGEYFRNVDCKLIYNLDVSTLLGVGGYSVAADFGHGPVSDPALFGLK